MREELFIRTTAARNDLLTQVGKLPSDDRLPVIESIERLWDAMMTERSACHSALKDMANELRELRRAIERLTMRTMNGMMFWWCVDGIGSIDIVGLEWGVPCVC